LSEDLGKRRTFVVELWEKRGGSERGGIEKEKPKSIYPWKKGGRSPIQEGEMGL